MILDNNKDYPVENANTLGNPPEEEWNKSLSIEGWGNCVQETPDDCYIIAGTCGFGYWWDAFLLKTDSQGNELWNNTYGTKLPRASYEFGKWVEVTKDGGYILVGCKDRSSYPNSNLDIWLIKTDINGNEEWNKTFDGDRSNIGFCVKQTEDGGYIITGQYNSKIILLKFNEYGYEEWYQTYFGGQGRSVEETGDGGFIISGSDSLHDNMIVIKTDENGNMLWHSKLPDEHGYSSGMRVEQAIDSGYIIGGFTDFYGAGRTDYWLVKLDSNGNLQWNKTFGTSDFDEGYSAIQTVDGGYIIGGCKTLNEEFWLVRTDGNGQVIWDKQYIPSIDARCLCIQQTKDNGYIATGLEGWAFINGCVLVKIGPDIQNYPPSPPTIDGPTTGKPGSTYKYTFTSIDPNGDDVSYYIKWGDGSVEDWSFFQTSGSPGYYKGHKWDEQDVYIIEAKAKDINSAESDWATFAIAMSRNVVSTISLFLRFFERFPNEFPILRHLIGL